MQNIFTARQKNSVGSGSRLSALFDEYPEAFAEQVSVATGALRFLYKVTLKRDWAVDEIPMPKRPFKLPVILSREEVMHFLDSVDSLKHRTILMTAYAAGLRVSEAIHLKVTDIDSQRMTLRVDQGKGRKDRYVMLSRACSRCCGPTGSRAPGAMAIPGDLSGQPITRAAVELACQKAHRASGLPSPLRRIRYVTRSPRICWNPAPIYAPFSSCWASQSGDHLTLPEGRYHYRVRYHQSIDCLPRIESPAILPAPPLISEVRDARRRARGGGYFPPGRCCLPPATR